jgi:hypothetical protein
VLARLDAVPGVRESLVDRSGRRFLVKLAPGALEERVVTDARAILGEDSLRLSGDEAATVLATHRRDEPWVRAGETMRLSRDEAKVLASRHGGWVARLADLDADRTERLVSLIEEEIAGAFERVLVSGDDPESALGGEVRSALERVATRSRAFLDDEQARSVLDCLDQFLSGGTEECCEGG